MKGVMRWIACFAIAVLLLAAVLPASAVTVQPGESIQDAINASQDDGTVTVAAGTYQESIVIGKPVRLAGEGMPVLDAGGTGSVIEIKAKNVEISGFVVTNAGTSPGDAGIRILADNATIRTVNASGNGNCGIVLLRADNATIENVTANENGRSGIWVEESALNTFTAIRGSGNGWDCISLVSANDNTLEDIEATGNTFGIWFTSSEDPNIQPKSVPSVSLAALFTPGGETGDAAASRLAGVAGEPDAGTGPSAYNRLTNVRADDNYVGLCLRWATGNIITDSRITRSDPENTGNGGGIYIEEAVGNFIYNNVISNTRNVISKVNPGNIWNTDLTDGTNIVGGPCLGGNFWGSPDGTGFSEVTPDADGNGICDDPFVIDANNTDLLPLAEYAVSLTADFTAEPTTGAAPLSVAFTDCSTGDPVAWAWQFGDGTASDERHPVHVYTDPGTYTVALTVTDAAGLNATATRTDLISVTGPEVPTEQPTEEPTTEPTKEPDDEPPEDAISPQEAISRLIGEIGELDLRHNVEVVLTVHLKSAAWSLEKSHDRVAVFKLNQFIKLVRSFAAHGQIGDADACYLEAKAGEIIALIAGGSPDANGADGCGDCCTGPCEDCQQAGQPGGTEKAGSGAGKQDIDTAKGSGGSAAGDTNGNGNGNGASGNKGNGSDKDGKTGNGNGGKDKGNTGNDNPGTGSKSGK